MSARPTVVPHLRLLSPPPHSLSLPGWRYSLHLYLDYGFPLSVLPTVVAALHSSFPFFRLTHSQLSPLQHLSLLLDCWEQHRWQLNGLSVLDVLEQQWEAGRQALAEAALATEAVSAYSSSTSHHRKRRRKGGGRPQDGTARLSPASYADRNWKHWRGEEHTEGSVQRVTALPGDSVRERTTKAAASRQLLPSNRPSAHRRADYVTAARYSTRAAIDLEQAIARQPPLVAPFSFTL